MAAANGNRYAEKWDKDSTLAMLEQVLAHIIENKCPYVGIALVEFDLYKEIWSYWKKAFVEDDEVFQLIKKIESRVEANLVKAGLTAKSPTMHIFTLKNHHGWVDKQEVEQSIKSEQPLTDEQLTEQAERILRRRKEQTD